MPLSIAPALSPSTRTRRRALAAVLLLGACACDAELRPLRLDRAAAPPPAVVRPEAGLHGHRDLQGDFEGVWTATVEALHARGVAVPRGALEESTRGVVHRGDLLLVVVQRAPGRVCLEATIPGLDEPTGRAQASELFDEISARLR